MNDVADTFDMGLKIKPLHAKPTIKVKESGKKKIIPPGIYTSSPHTTQNVLKLSLESAASNLVSHTMKSTGKCNIKKYTLSECKKKQKPVKCSSCKHIFKTFVELTKHMSRRYIQISSTNASTALKHLTHSHGSINIRQDIKD